MSDPSSEAELEALAHLLAALAHPRRLELLWILREPRSAGEIELRPWRQALDARPDRAISRSAVERHLQTLESIDVVRRKEGERDGKSVGEFVLDHARLFAIIESLRALGRLRPSVDLDSRETMHALRPAGTPGTRGRPAATHLVMLSGPREGEIVSLEGAGAWSIGRERWNKIALDHDPFVSALHAEILLKDGTWTIHDLGRNKNGTWLNWAATPRGSATELASGDVIGVGRSLLLFQLKPR